MNLQEGTHSNSTGQSLPGLGELASSVLPPAEINFVLTFCNARVGAFEWQGIPALFREPVLLAQLTKKEPVVLLAAKQLLDFFVVVAYIIS